MSRASFTVNTAPEGIEKILKLTADFLGTMGYTPVEPEIPESSLFKHDMGFLVSPKYIAVIPVDENRKSHIRFEGYVVYNLLPDTGKIGEAAFSTGGFAGIIPRKSGYNDFLKLRDHLGGSNLSLLSNVYFKEYQIPKT